MGEVESGSAVVCCFIYEAEIHGGNIMWHMYDRLYLLQMGINGCRAQMEAPLCVLINLLCIDLFHENTPMIPKLDHSHRLISFYSRH